MAKCKFTFALCALGGLFLCLVQPIPGLPSAALAQSKRVWNISELINERQLDVADKKKPSYCNGGVFKPCVCARDVTKLVQYRPAVRECGKKAAIILSGRYLNAFSAVVRDYENKDRWPAAGANGCTAYERDVLALNKCSVFKTQKVIGVENDKGDAHVLCLGASGYSKLFSRVRRITVKLADVPNSSNDPIARLCLKGPTKPLN